MQTSQLELFGMTCGHLRMPFPFLVAGETGWIDVPVPAFLIVHPKGTVLFDTGLPPGIRHDKAREIGDVAEYFEPDLSPEAELDARLEMAGHDIARIDYLVNSHLHFDHAGGNRLVPNAQLVVQRREWEAGRLPETRAANHFNPDHYDLGHDRLEVDGEHDLFGDGSVVCVPTFGHTPGHQSLKVRTKDGEVVLCADACYLRRTIEDLALPEPIAVSDREGMLRSLQHLRTLEAAGARLVYGHDNALWANLNSGPLSTIRASDVVRALAASRT